MKSIYKKNPGIFFTLAAAVYYVTYGFHPGFAKNDDFKILLDTCKLKSVTDFAVKYKKNGGYLQAILPILRLCERNTELAEKSLLPLKKQMTILSVTPDLETYIKATSNKELSAAIEKYISKYALFGAKLQEMEKRGFLAPIQIKNIKELMLQMDSRRVSQILNSNLDDSSKIDAINAIIKSMDKTIRTFENALTD